ncbi:MAG TPA: fused MFS/spermidine synthase [Fimbriimonadaceae bacterium]|nr:fused MFS/spermidine synthase [Fimbriimonadaceae bacterium]
MRALYTLTLFLSSGLLFLVQPMVAKMILPRFGGSPAVWTTSMLFFQVLLLAGYAYAHAGVQWLGPKKQAVLHILVLIAAAILCRLSLPAESGLENSPWQVLLVLLGMVGAPFFALSAGAPIIQGWFATTRDPHAKDPYFLYSASNLGSMIALLAYPFLLEPALPLTDQAHIWQFGLFGLIALMAGCAVWVGKQNPQVEERPEKETLTWPRRLTWVALAAVPSSLLLGVTNYMTTNVAPMPLLWIVPLAIYLATFIVAFAKRKMPSSKLWARILPLVVTPLALVMILEATEPMFLLLAIHLLAFTMAALMCHSRLAETRPPAGNLTEFYLWLSVGGAVGGLFNALLAPYLFSTLAEYPIALVAACLLRPPKPDSKAKRSLDFGAAVTMLLLVIGLALLAQQLGMAPSQARTGLVIGLPAILCFLMVDHPIRYGLMLGSLFLGSQLMHTNSAGLVAFSGRSFFGVHRVVFLQNERFHELVHGTTTHGIQDTLHPSEPLTYYTRSGPIGQVFASFPELKRIALVGLGVGSCAAYGKPGQTMTYFEIDPVVEQVAKDPKYFTYLKDTKADLNVVLGDARLTLGQQSGPYDLIELDAFSSDSIPLHLLTLEAVTMYRSKLAEHGILAFHISNRYLNLEPILGKIAQKLGMAIYSQEDSPTDEEILTGKRPSRWVVMANLDSDLTNLVKGSTWFPPMIPENTPLWADGYSNILSAFARRND